MPEEFTPAQKAARTRKLRVLERETQQKHLNAFTKARASEAASKEALRAYCEKNNWRVAFFEGKTGSPRTGIIDAIIFRISRGNADVLDLRLVQLKGGKAGISGMEISRLKKATGAVVVNWLAAAFDGSVLHLLPEELEVTNAPHTPGALMSPEVEKRSEAAKRAWITIRANRAKVGRNATKASSTVGPSKWAGVKPPSVKQKQWDAGIAEVNAQIDLEESVEYPDIIKHLSDVGKPLQRTKVLR